MGGWGGAGVAGSVRPHPRLFARLICRGSGPHCLLYAVKVTQGLTARMEGGEPPPPPPLLQPNATPHPICCLCKKKIFPPPTHLHPHDSFLSLQNLQPSLLLRSTSSLCLLHPIKPLWVITVMDWPAWGGGGRGGWRWEVRLLGGQLGEGEGGLGVHE